MYTIRVMIMRFHLSKSIHPMLLFENPLESWTVLMVGKQVFIILLTILIIILIIIIIILVLIIIIIINFRVTLKR